jgi:ligand-binding sensor domain-containing protein
LPDIDPRSLFVDSRGWLWIGQRYKGVSVTKEPAADHPSFIQYSTGNGLLSDTAWAFTEDDEGRVYVGTARGLSRFDPRTNSWQGFTSKDGLAGDDIRSFFKDKQSHIWIAGEGVSRFDPRAEHKASEPPPTYISRVSIMGKDLALPETGTVLVAPMKWRVFNSNNLTIIDSVGVQFQGEDTLLTNTNLKALTQTGAHRPNRVR